MNPFMRATYQEDPEGLDIAMLGVPFDLGSSFRTGARHGPAQVREMSRMIRQVHYPSMLAPFKECSIADIGDAPVNPLDIDESLRSIEAFIARVHAVDALPLAVGGDHTVTLPILRAIAKGGPLALIQIDAHSDTIDEMMGKRYANGTPIRRAIEERLLDPKRVVQVGLRGTLFQANDLDWARSQGIHIIDMDDFCEMGMAQTLKVMADVVGDHPVYLTFDIDVLDPACAPGAGGLEIGGLTSREAQALLRGLSGLHFVGADINEVSPPLDPSGITAVVGSQLMFEQLCLLVESVKSGNRSL
jgi:guanidinopropionase